MTKGRAALPAIVVAEQDRFFIALTSPAQGRTADTADLSTTLLRSSGRDDKGEGGASIECGCRTETIFHHLGRAKAHNFSGRDDNGERGASIRSRCEMRTAVHHLSAAFDPADTFPRSTPLPFVISTGA